MLADRLGARGAALQTLVEAADDGLLAWAIEWHLDHGFLNHLTGMQVLWALLAAGYNLFQLFLARRIRRRGPWEQTDRGVAERLRAELLVGEGALGLYLVPDAS